MSVTYNGTNYYYATNLQGDITAILNASGTAVVQYTYDAWGSPLSVTGTMAETLGVVNPLRYRGYVYDTETQFYYLQSRYYDPEIGRFINADSYASTGQGILGNNMFAYCNNNPVNYVDPYGYSLLSILPSIRRIAKTIADTIAEIIFSSEDAQDYDDFLDALAMSESSDNYGAKNQYGYLGRYQMGSLALQDVGLKDSSNNWTEYAESLGIYSDDDFLNSPQVQDMAIKECHKKICGYIIAYDLDQYIGTTYQGVTITESGLLAACHLVGIGSMRDALRNGTVAVDGNNMSAHEYMERFGGYDISEVWPNG